MKKCSNIMAKIKITQTNGASAADISDAIGQFLEQKKTERFLDAMDQAKEGDEHAFDGMTLYVDQKDDCNGC